MNIQLAQFLVFALVLTRLSGLFLIAPFFSASAIPVRVRALLVAALAFIITPTQWNVPLDFPRTVIDLAIVLFAELIVGLALGLGVAIFFLAFQFSGRLIGQVTGLGLANTADPDFGSQTSIFGLFLFQLGMAIFVMIGGHRLVLAGLLDTFAAIQPGTASVAASFPDAIARLLTQAYSVGFRVAAPTVAAQLLASLVLGLISRTMPQLNILMVGFGFKAAVSLAVLATTLGGIAWTLEGQIGPVMENWLAALDFLPAVDGEPHPIMPAQPPLAP